MGNQSYIYHDGKHVGTINSGLASIAYLQKYVIEKYNPHFSLFSQNVNEQLDVVYDKCSKSEEIQLLIFINDESSFEENDIKHFEQAINNYPENINDGPKRILEKFLTLLKEYKTLTTSYKFTDCAIAVIEKQKPESCETGLAID